MPARLLNVYDQWIMAKLRDAAYKALGEMLDGERLFFLDIKKGYGRYSGWKVGIYGERIHSRVAWGLVSKGYVLECSPDAPDIYEISEKGRQAWKEGRLERL